MYFKHILFYHPLYSSLAILIFIIFYVCKCFLHTGLCIMCMPGAPEGQKRAWKPPKLELQIVVGNHADVENQICVL